MRAVRKQRHRQDVRDEYDFSNGVRGKYASRPSKDAPVVVLAPDVAEVFKTAKSVNAALRSQLKKKSSQPGRRRRAGR